MLTHSDNLIKERLLNFKKHGLANRYGALFATTQNVYFYDAGTQKAIILDDKTFFVLEKFFNPSVGHTEFAQSFEQYSPEEECDFFTAIASEHLFELPYVKTMYFDKTGDVETQINTRLQQLILEVADGCNFRCKYCIYNEDYEGDRNFGSSHMSVDIALKAIDYAFDHSEKRLAITFYGGEPLLNYSLITEAIKYAQKKNLDYKKELSFSMTSNMALVTSEIAKFIAETPSFEFIASIDGPDIIHNAARVYAGGKATHHDVERGLRLISEAFIAAGRTTIGINVVLTSPYTFEKLEAINTYFSNLEFLPIDAYVQITYASPGTFDDSAFWAIAAENPKYYHMGVANPLIKWQMGKVMQYGLDVKSQKNIYAKNMIDRLASIDGRFILHTPDDEFYCNGNCVPGMRKLYVKVDGSLTACERIGSSPSFGNIYTGIDHSLLKKKYMDEYIENSLPDCRQCWAINHCSICYAVCFDGNGINMEEKKQRCADVRDNLLRDLGIYYTLQEDMPDKLQFLKDVTFS